MGLSLSLIPLFVLVYKRYDASVLSTFVYVSLYVLYFIFSPTSDLRPLSDVDRLGYTMNASLSFLSTIILLLLSIYISKKGTKKLLDAFPHLMLVNSLLVISGFLINKKMNGGYGFNGIIDYPGINACLIATCFLLTKNKWFWSAYSVAIILSFSSVPYGVLSVVVTSYLLSRKNKYWYVGLFLLFLGGVFEGKNYLDSGNRFLAYKTFMGYWWNLANKAFGFGPFTFPVLGEIIQKKTGFDVRGETLWKWFWIHSDLLQIVFEFGVVGLTLFGWAIYTRIKKLYENPAYFSCSMGILASAVFNFPVRYFPFCVLIFILLAYTGKE